MQTQRTLLRAVSLSCIVFCLFLNRVPAICGSTDYAGSVTEIIFGGNGRIPLRIDPTPAEPCSAMPSRWARGQQPIAVAYVSGTVPALGVTLQIPTGTPLASALVRGIGPDGMTFRSMRVAATMSGGTATLVYAPQSASRPFEPGMVCTYEPFVVDWEISVNGGANWIRRATSSNVVYVTYKRPVDEKPEVGYAYYESLFRISCRNSVSAATESEIIQGVWNDFTDRAIRTGQGDTLAFYRHKHIDQEITTAGLLLSKSGICFAWSHLLIDLLRIQGISRHGCFVWLSAPDSVPQGSVVGMLMPNCQFLNPSGADVCAEFPYVAAFDPNHSLDLIGPDVRSLSGVGAQGEPDPVSLFREHTIVCLDSVYYDPSYGRTYASLEEFYNNLAGWVVLGRANEMAMKFDLNGDGAIQNVDVAVARVSRSPRAVPLIVNRQDY